MRDLCFPHGSGASVRGAALPYGRLDWAKACSGDFRVKSWSDSSPILLQVQLPRVPNLIFYILIKMCPWTADVQRQFVRPGNHTPHIHTSNTMHVNQIHSTQIQQVIIK